MTGPKLNEKSRVVGERSGTKATARYVRSSASKARAVLDLIRGLDVVAADEVLQFTDRHIAHEVRKVLASAVANAVNNDNQEAEELFVIACFADEGPTLRRFRPRARGRATRINKRTCHITLIVARMSDDRLSIVQARRERQGGARASGRPQSSASSRRARVERSRKAAAAEQPTVDEVQDAHDEAGDDSDEIVPGEWAGSALPLDDGGMPEGYEIKGNAGSMLYHEPGSRYYGATKAEVWFDSVESAEAAGFSKPGAATEETATEETPAAGSSDAATDETGVDSDPDDDETTS
jgi:large subunit ribosomal protein L22